MNGAVRKSYNNLEPDSGKNNSPQFNVSLRFIRVFYLVPLLERFSYDLEIKTRKQNRKKQKNGNRAI